ncbi:hypothetical protein ACFQZ2_04180 [Streptomonospora algeriensis]
MGLLGALFFLPPPSLASATPQNPVASKNAPQDETPSPIASATSNERNEKITESSADILELKNSDVSDFAYITVRITHNGTTENMHDHWFSNPTYIYREPIFSGVTLVGSDHNIRHHPVMDENGYCSCSGYSPRSPYAPFVRPGQSIDYWAMYSIPQDVSNVDVEIPGFDPIEDVPVE